MTASDLLSLTGPYAPRIRSLLQAIRNSNVCVLYQTPDLIYIWGENIPSYWQKNWKPGGQDSDFIISGSLPKLEHAKQTALQTGQSQRIELSINNRGKIHWIEFYIDCDRTMDGILIGLITTANEITELKRREQILTTLLREVSHRSKNLLAIVQSIINQTARFTGSVDDFLLKFRGRIHSLAYSQDLVTESNWHGALFADLARSQIEKYVDIDDTRLSISGDNPYLFPNAALHIGLALHELIINAVSFGGFSVPNGKVEISTTIVRSDDAADQLILHWEELIPALSDSYQHDPRFGSAVLQRIVPSAVNGRTEYRVDGSGVTYNLIIPSDQFDG